MDVKNVFTQIVSPHVSTSILASLTKAAQFKHFRKIQLFVQLSNKGMHSAQPKYKFSKVPICIHITRLLQRHSR